MAQVRISMRRIREILRLKWQCSRSLSDIAVSCGIARSTASECISRAVEAGLSWPLVEGLDDAALEALLYPPRSERQEIPAPDWARMNEELKKKYVTRELLWQEYKAENRSGYQYSQFCTLFRQWQKRLNPVLRNEHRAGEKAFIDYAGKAIPIVDPQTGRVRQAQVFVCVLGASNYTFAEATWSQELPNWIASHVRAFEYFGGTPEILVPDNLKAGVQRPCRYDPDINPTYYAMARHYNCAVIPARSKKPRDKAKVEAGVLVVGRWIIAALRNQKFFCLEQLNLAIRELLEKLNGKRFKKIPGSRRELFERLERPSLQPLPSQRFEYTYIKQAMVNIDYHVEVAGHCYSVPYILVRRQVEVRFNESVVEILYKNQRVASHRRNLNKGGFTTLPEHRPPNHRQYVEWSPERVLRWAKDASPSAAKVAEKIMNSRPHPELGFRAILGLIRLGEKFGKDRLESACQRALVIGSPSFKSVKSILKTGLDKKPLEVRTPEAAPVEHPNIRGAQHYNQIH